MLTLNQFLIFAADDWWQVVGTIIVFLFYGVGHLLSGREEAQKRAQGKPKRAAPPPVAKADGQPQPQNQADPLRAEVEEFLRRAEGQKPREARPAGRAEPQRDRPPGMPQRESQPVPRRAVLTEPAAASPEREPPRPRKPRRVAQQKPAETRREGIAEHVQRHMSTADVTDSAEHLGEKVALADDKLEARLEQKFEHQLGRLKHVETKEEEVGPSIAQQVRQLLGNPEGMRQVIVANEILRRPEERW